MGIIDVLALVLIVLILWQIFSSLVPVPREYSLILLVLLILFFFYRGHGHRWFGSAEDARSSQAA